jgi:gamma-glutamyl hercynylcysteine S-oxide synthase
MPPDASISPTNGTRSRLGMTGGCAGARIARPAYRNFFTPDRSDVFAGFRACALYRSSTLS